MLATTDAYLQRLVALREHGFALAELREREGRLNFNRFMTPCGTHGCLLGWWVTTEYAQSDGWAFSPNDVPVWEGHGTESPEQYFGIDSGGWLRLFGTNPKNTLADRRAYLDTLIAERMQVTA